MTFAFPSNNEPVIDSASGRMRPNWYSVFFRLVERLKAIDTSISGGDTSIQGQIDTINTTLATKAAKADQTGSGTVFVVYPENRAYAVHMRVDKAFTLTETSTQTAASTVTVTVRKNGSSIGSTHSATTSENAIARSTAFAVNDDLDILLSSTSSTCEGLRFSFKVEFDLT